MYIYSIMKEYSTKLFVITLLLLLLFLILFIYFVVSANSEIQLFSPNSGEHNES